MKPDKDLDGDLAMELVELAAHGAGGQGCAMEIVRIIREMIRQEIAKEDSDV